MLDRAASPTDGGVGADHFNVKEKRSLNLASASVEKTRNWVTVFSLHLFLEEIALPTQVLYFLINLIHFALIALEIAMLVRAVLSWVVVASDGGPARLYGFFTMITEPIVLPFRKLFDRMGWGADVPIDLPFMAAYLAIILVSLFV